MSQRWVEEQEIWSKTSVGRLGKEKGKERRNRECSLGFSPSHIARIRFSTYIEFCQGTGAEL